MRRGGLPLSPPSTASPLPPLVLATFHNPNAQWDERVSALKALSSAAQSRAVSTPGTPAREAFLFQLRELGTPLSHCISDLRSTLVKEVCMCVAELAQMLGAHFVEAVGNDVIAALLKRSNATKAVIRDGAINAARAMFENGVNGISFETARLLSRSVQNRKISSSMRAASAEFLGMILVEDCLSGLQAIREAVEDAVVHGCEDPDEHVRAISRDNWRRLEMLDEHVAHLLLTRMSPHVTALVQREKNASPRSENSSPKVSDRAGSPRSPGRTTTFAHHRPPLTAKRAYPQRVPNGGARLDMADTSPTGANRSPLKSHTTSTSATSSVLRAGARHRTGAARVPRPQARGNENRSGSVNIRQALPPRPGVQSGDAGGKLQVRGALNRKSTRPISRPPRPPRRSVAPNTTINFQSLWSPPGATEAVRRKGRQSVPVGLNMPTIPEEESAAPIPMAQLTSPPPNAPFDPVRAKSLSPRSPDTGNAQGSPMRESPGEPMAEKSPSSGNTEMHASPTAQVKPEHQSSQAESSSTPSGESRSPSTIDFVRGIVAGAIRSLHTSTETKADETKNVSPGNDQTLNSAANDVSVGRESSDFVSVSTVGSGDLEDGGARVEPANTPKSLRKGRLSFILGKTVSSLDRFRSTSKVESVAIEPENDLKWEKAASPNPHDFPVPTARTSPVPRVETNESTTQDSLEENMKPTARDIALLMNIASLTEEKAEAYLFTGMAPLDAEVGLEQPSESRSAIATEKEMPSWEQVMKGIASDIAETQEDGAKEHDGSTGKQPSSENAGLQTHESVDEADDGKENERIRSLDMAGAQTARPGPEAEKSTSAKTTGDTDVDAAQASKPFRSRQVVASRGRGPRRSVMPGTTIRLNDAALDTESGSREERRAPLPKPSRDVVVRSPAGKPKKAAQARLKARVPRRSIMPGATIRLQEAGAPNVSLEKKVERPDRPPKMGPRSTTISVKARTRPPNGASTTVVARKARPRGGGAPRRSIMPGTNIEPPITTKDYNAGNDGETSTKGGESSSDHSSSDGNGSATRDPSLSTDFVPTKKKKVMSTALQGVIDWLRQANRIKRGGWQERCQVLKGFGEACKQLDGERIGVRLAEDCVSMLGDYVHETHHKVVSGALDGLFFLLLCSVGSSNNLQKGLEKRDDVLRRTLGLLIGGKENVRLAAGRVMQSFEVQFRPEIMVGLVMRALGHVSGTESRHRNGSVADGRVAEMGCAQLGKAFERAATSGEGFIWKTGLLEAVLTGLEGMTKDRRVAVRRGANSVVEKVRLSLPNRAFEMACDKYGVHFGEADK